jgi:hypothetical protein
MKQLIFYNSEIQKILKEYYIKRMEYLLKGIKLEPYEIMEEINHAEEH